LLYLFNDPFKLGHYRVVLFHQVSRKVRIAPNGAKTGIFGGDLTFLVLWPYLFSNLVSSPQIEVGKKLS